MEPTLTVKVHCRHLPGPSCTVIAGGAPVRYDDLHLGVQVGEEVTQVVPATGAPVDFELTFRVAPLPDGAVNFLGPAAKGTPRERFFYLVWSGTVAGHLAHAFRRAKIHLSHLPGAEVLAAAAAGRPLPVTIGMTDAKGEPRCASVRPPVAVWEVGGGG